MKEVLALALDELRGVAEALDGDSVESACRMIRDARRIVVHGCGREGLQTRGFAMRLYHLGLDASVQGDMTAPPVGEGDLLVASAGPGELSTVAALMRVAREAGARILFLTAVPTSPSARLADHVLAIPAQTMANDTGEAPSTLPMGSLYEGALFLLFEAMVLRLGDLAGVDPREMRARHANLE